MYATTNPKTKKALKDALASGKRVAVFCPGLGSVPKDGSKVTLEGPHYPAPHSWYATCRVDTDGYIIPGTVK
jgi:hypothetical protein